MTLSNFEELLTYVTIVESGSLAAAAARLGLTPNAISRRLAVLEARLGRRLIHRTTRRLSVTDEGHLFHTRCRRILDELEEAERELSGEDDFAGTLRIAIHHDMVCPRLIELLQGMLSDHLGLRLQLRVADGFLDPVRWNLDFAVFLGDPPASTLVSVPLGPLRWGLAAAPSYLERHGRPQVPEDLVHHECLRVLRDRPETHWALQRSGGRPKRYPIGGRFETSDSSVLVQATFAGAGIGIQLMSALSAAVQSGTLERVLPGWHWGSTPIHALLPKGRNRIPRVKAALDIIRKAMASLG